MRYLYMLLLVFLSIVSFSIAQDDLDFETVTVVASDDLELVADLYLPDVNEGSNPAVMLLHMVGGNRGAYEPIIPVLIEAGYGVLNVDMRGHGGTRGNQDWDLAIADVQTWLDWLREQNGIDGSRIAIIGASIGSNVGLIGCANDAACVGAIALSPGLNYFGVQPEDAVVDGLADRSALLVASHRDGASAEAIQQMFMNATGDVSARLYVGAAHGTNLLRSSLDSVSNIILSWLDDHMQVADA